MTPMLGIMASAITGNLVTSSYESIATVSASGGTTTVSFTSIPATFKHLQIRGIATGVDDAGSSGSLTMRFNSITTSTYNRHTLYGNGTSALSAGTASTTNILLSGVNQPLMLNYPYGYIVDIIDYADTTKFKTTKSTAGCSASNVYSSEINLGSGLFRSTAAITSITLTSPGFYAGTSFALYGIKG